MMTEDGEAPASPRRSPSLADALKWLAFAIVFAGLSWLEHTWRLSRGDYPSVGLDHTWYWHVTTWGAVVFLVGRLIWRLVRWSRS
jgi:hypothetical protein